MAQVKDPVCGMMVDSETTQFKSEYKGQTYYFCTTGCKTAFDKEPEKYLAYDEHSQHDQSKHH
jgi:YHS domain-containing protein